MSWSTFACDKCCYRSSPHLNKIWLAIPKHEFWTFSFDQDIYGPEEGAMPLFFPTSVYLSLAQIWSVHVWWRRRDQCRSSFPWPNKQQHRRFVSQVEGSKKGHGWSILQGRGERERCCLSPARGEDIACCSTDSVVFLCWLRQTSSLNICHRRVSERILD